MSQRGSKQHSGKHRKQSRRRKAIAAVGVATATATALTAGIAPPPDPNTAKFPVALMAAAGPNYSQIIENTSNALDNVLFTQANFTNALGSLLNPLGEASGGLLPTFGATVSQDNLLTVEGLVEALATVLAGLTSPPPGLGNVPGLPAGAGGQLFSNLLPALGLVGSLIPIGSILAELATVPVALDGVVGTLNGLNATLNSVLGPLLAPLPAPQIGGIPDVTGVLDDLLASLGAKLSLTQYESQFNWPILGIGGQSDVTNLFAQIPSLAVGVLVNTLLGDLNSTLTVPDLSLLGIPIPPVLDDLSGQVTGALGPLTDLLDSLVTTPEITLWDPTASGLYTLPLGGSFGYLATMPVVDIGPLTLAGIPLSTSDTVLGLPIGAAGITLPLNLASFGVLSTPGLVFPTATGVSSLGGTTLTSLTLLGLINWTNLNTLNSFYVGTNGININTGQNAGLLGPLPYEFSLGAFNIGTAGFGFTLPSIAGIGLLPPIQIGTAPVQTSDDGLLPAQLPGGLPGPINLGLAIPTQVTDVATLLGLPSIQTTVINPFVNPIFNATVAPAGGAFTSFLNDNVGSWADASSNAALLVTSFIEKLSEGLPGATPKPAAASTMNILAAPANKTVAPPTTGNVADAKITPKNGPILKILRGTQTSVKPAIGTAAATGTSARPTPVKDVVTGVRTEVNKAVDKVGSDIKKAGENVSKALGAKKKTKATA